MDPLQLSSPQSDAVISSRSAEDPDRLFGMCRRGYGAFGTTDWKVKINAVI